DAEGDHLLVRALGAHLDHRADGQPTQADRGVGGHAVAQVGGAHRELDLSVPVRPGDLPGARQHQRGHDEHADAARAQAPSGGAVDVSAHPPHPEKLTVALRPHMHSVRIMSVVTISTRLARMARPEAMPTPSGPPPAWKPW